jgi:hypothetical protein
MRSSNSIQVPQTNIILAILPHRPTREAVGRHA